MKLKFPDIPFNIESIDVLKDGNCMFHSILQAFNKTYNSSNLLGKTKIVRKFRSNLAKVLNEKNQEGKDYYSEILEFYKGEGVDYSNFITKDFLIEILESNEWGEVCLLQHISNQLDIDIYFLTYPDMNLFKEEGYKEMMKSMCKGRKSIILLNINGAHFETVGLRVNGKIKTLFDPNHDLIKCINKLIHD